MKSASLWWGSTKWEYTRSGWKMPWVMARASATQRKRWLPRTTGGSQHWSLRTSGWWHFNRLIPVFRPFLGQLFRLFLSPKFGTPVNRELYSTGHFLSLIYSKFPVQWDLMFVLGLIFAQKIILNCHHIGLVSSFWRLDSDLLQLLSASKLLSTEGLVGTSDSRKKEKAGLGLQKRGEGKLNCPRTSEVQIMK